MSVCRIQKESNYTVISNKLLRDKNLSLKAVGLLSRVLSLPENWNYSVSGLVSICKENRSAIESTLKELQSHGYLVVNKLLPGTVDIRTNKVRSQIEYEYVFYEQPINVQDIENQLVETQLQINKEIPNKEIENKEIIKGPENLVSSVQELQKSYSSDKPRRNYTAKPIIQVEEENKRLSRQQKKQLKIKDMLDVIPKEYSFSQALINALGDYLDMRIGLHIGKIDRAWFEKEWQENIYPALTKHTEEEVVRYIRTVVIPKSYKRCFINISTYQPRSTNFNDGKQYTMTEMEQARLQGTLAVEQAKRDGTYRSEF
jgi:hypothetical protein